MDAEEYGYILECFAFADLKRSLRAYQQGHIGGFLHLYIGQEAVAVGAVSVMSEDDHVITAYRDPWAYNLTWLAWIWMNVWLNSLGSRPVALRERKGGSMHFFADKNFWGGHGIVGGQTPLGLGIAYALKNKGIKGMPLFHGRWGNKPRPILRVFKFGIPLEVTGDLHHRK